MTALITATQYEQMNGEALGSGQEWVLDVASDIVRNVTSRLFLEDDYDLVYLISKANPVIYLNEYPVELSGFAAYYPSGDTWVEYASKNYIISPKTGRVNLYDRGSGLLYHKYIRFVYHAGYAQADLPNEIVFAVAKLAKLVKDGEFGSTIYIQERIGDYWYRVPTRAPFGLGGVPVEVQTILSRYVNNNYVETYDPATVIT